MFEYAIYVICPPERCAEILWRDVDKKELAASALKLTAQDLYKLKIIDKVLPEPRGGAHRNPDGAAQLLAEEIEIFLDAAKRGAWTVQKRRQKFRQMGAWFEDIANANSAAD